jgi:transcriptional regulator with XRE-family HTH domain
MARRAKPATLPVVIASLVAMREEAGITKANLADRLGYSYDAIAGWENGTITPSFQSLINWCQFFDLELDARRRG